MAHEHLESTAGATSRLAPAASGWTGASSPDWRRADLVTALTLFGVGLLLLGIGITWGLPHATTPDRVSPWGSDELAPLGPFAQIFHVVLHRGTAFDPRYPLLPYLLFGAAEAPYLLWLKMTGGMTGMSTAFPFGLRDPSRALATLTLFARMLNLLLAAALPVVAYRTGTLLRDRRTGVLSGALVLGTYPFAFYGRTSNVDMMAIFWSGLGLLVFATCLRDGLTIRRAIALGVFAALATATKDQYYALFTGMGVVLVARHLLAAGRDRWAARRTWAPLVAGFLTGLVVYAGASGMALNPDAFSRHLAFVRGEGRGGYSGHSYFSTPATLAGYTGLVVRSAQLVANSIGLPATLAAAAGLVVAARRSRQLLWFALPLLALLLGVILPARFVRIRFVLVAAYVACFFAALALDELLTWARDRRPASSADRRPGSVAAIAGVVLVVGCSLARVGDLTQQMLRDSRYAAAEWFADYTRAGDDVGFYGASMKLPALPSGVRLTPAPWSTMVEISDNVRLPAFIAVIPQQPFEITHEWSLPDSVYAGLLDGSRGYQLVFAVQSPSLFPARVISWVNPPVRIFARRDRAAALPDSSRKVDLGM